MRKSFYLLPIICLFILISCKNDDSKKTAQKIVTEWIGRSITMPTDTRTIRMGKDTIIEMKETPYKILVYTDSTGCVSCKLRLSTWKYYMEEIDSIVPGQVNFMFYFQPKSIKEMAYIFRRERFTHPVYIDQPGTIYKINNFPSQMEYQCFLLDNENKVIAIGNPTLNPQIWELYKKLIRNGNDDKKNIITTVEIEQKEIEIENMKTDEVSTAVFTLKNTGTKPLLINHVDASCGCTRPHWETRPIKPEEMTEIKVEIKPNNAGFFNKTVYVYANTNEKVIPLNIRGTAK